MHRRDFIEKTLIGGIGLAGLGVLNEGFLLADDPGGPGTRRRKNIDPGWKFHLGDAQGAERVSYRDQGWRTLDLPHDWSIEGKIDRATGLYPGGIGWYRKELPWDSSWKERKVYVDFDGVFMNSDVWINGHHLGHRPYGYISFRYDLTPYLKPGNNIMAVRVDNARQPSARWYTGSGIYRHVWLNITDMVHVDHWGTFVSTPAVSAGQASVRIHTRVVNHRHKDKQLVVAQSVLSNSGRLVSTTQSQLNVKAGSQNKLEQTLDVLHPSLWSPASPAIYEVRTDIKEGERLVDRYYSPLGIRKLEFSPDWGFRLNGEPMIFKGTCNHDNSDGILGSAIPDEVLYWRLKRLKEMGSNAVRTSHNPRSPEFYAFCDVLGLMVMDEAFDGWDKPKAKYDYGLYFGQWWKDDLKSFILRDRNHPCVVMWSIGNEVSGYTGEREKELVDFIHDLDDTRSVTRGEGITPYLDIAGFNGRGEQKDVLQSYHEKNPRRPVIGTEMTHTLQTRGVYRTQSQYRARDFPARWEKGENWNTYKEKVYLIPNLSEEEVFTDVPEIYKSSYDNCIIRIGVRDQFKHDSGYPFLMGSFRWCGFDYLGKEYSEQPLRSVDKGVIDLAGITKDHYYLYQSLWTDKPMVHLLPHWTHPGKQGLKIPVVAYSNCRIVELFFNGRSLGAQYMGDDLQLVWQVPYEPGILVAVGKDIRGIKLAQAIQQTAGAPYGIRIEGDRRSIKADRKSIARFEITVSDKEGVAVPDADSGIEVKIDGPATLLGLDNGDVADLTEARSSQRKVFKGKCAGIIQTTGQRGKVRITVTSENLKQAMYTLHAV